MSRSRVAVLLSMFLIFSAVSCSNAPQNSRPIAKPAKGDVSSDGKASEPATDSLGSEIIPPEEISGHLQSGENAGRLTLPTSFPRRTGDLDQMLRARSIRVLVVLNPISFFYQGGKPKGVLYESLEELERVVNKKFKTGALKVKITFIPLRPDQLAAALTQGVGDFVAPGVLITPERRERFAFTTPIIKNVTRIIVTGKEVANAKSFDDLVGRDIYVSPLSPSYDNLKKISDERVKAGKAPLSVKSADKNLLEDDLIEMVNAGLIQATVAIQQRATLWEQVLPNVKLHPEAVVASGGELGWVMRKDNPELKKLLDEFVETHGAGTSFGNTLLRRYLQNAKWIKNSTSPEEMKKFTALVEYFKKHSADYNFDYLMITAQAYQESLLDQSRRSKAGALGIMQVIPKYAAAKPISVPDVRTADKNILAGVRMLNNIATTYFNDPGIDPVNKTLFTFASYNAGPNRIVRLRKKAETEGLDPNKWFGNVELEVAKGIGQETTTYVSNIYKYYIAYKLTAERNAELQKLKAAGM